MLQIAIGRVDYESGEDMSESMWLDFQSSIEELICTETGSLSDTKALGRSHYEDFREETCLFVWFFVESLSEETHRKLAILARAFGQDAIAITKGDTEFIKGA